MRVVSAFAPWSMEGGDDMKAPSLWQPWASAIAVGAKRVETRSWPTNYRGPLRPLGAIVATCRLVDCKPTGSFTQAELDAIRMPDGETLLLYGWMLDDVEMLGAPIPCVGRQGLFEVPELEYAQ